MKSPPRPIAFQAPCATSIAEAGGAAASRVMAQAGNALLQGDAPGALQALASVPATAFSPDQAAERACLLERFDRSSPPSLPIPAPDEFIQAQVGMYHRHWWYCLTSPGRRAALEQALMDELRSLLGLPATQAVDFGALAPALSERLRQAGCHALPPGRTAPLQDLMIWRSQESRDVEVELPEGVQRVRLVVLDDFVERGWGHYARCGYSSAAGWATPEGLFAVRPAYGDLESEKFRVSLLGHEAQHFADYQRFPGLLGWELEYRAKLTELALAQTTQAALLARFEAAQGDDPASPHAYANRHALGAITAHLGRGVAQADVEALQAAARAALAADSAQRAYTHPAPAQT